MSNLQGYSTPSSILSKSLKQNLGDLQFNNKEIKNISFLPFLRERNGLGRIIESVSLANSLESYISQTI